MSKFVPFSQSYLGQLRAVVGNRMLLVPGTRIIIERDGKVLLQHRRDFDTWGVPGGAADPMESVEENIRREVKEETGLTLLELVPFGLASKPEFETVTFPNGDQCHFFATLFVSHEFEGALRVDGEEGIALEWFSLEELPEMLPNMKRTIQAWQIYRDTGEFQLT